MPDEPNVTHAKRFGDYIMFVKITGVRASIQRVGTERHAGDHSAAPAQREPCSAQGDGSTVVAGRLERTGSPGHRPLYR